MITSSTSFFYVKSIEADRHDYKDAPLRLNLWGSGASDTQFDRAEIIIFIDNDDLADRLIAAINGAANLAQTAEEVQS